MRLARITIVTRNGKFAIHQQKIIIFTRITSFAKFTKITKVTRTIRITISTMITILAKIYIFIILTMFTMFTIFIYTWGICRYDINTIVVIITVSIVHILHPIGFKYHHHCHRVDVNVSGGGWQEDEPDCELPSADNDAGGENSKF